MQPPSFGPGSQILGGASNVTQAMPQPGGSNVLTQQVSPASAIFNPGIQVPPQPQMPEKSPMSNFAQGLAGQPAQKPPVDPLHARADTIIRALTAHLATLDKLFNTGGAR